MNSFLLSVKICENCCSTKKKQHTRTFTTITWPAVQTPQHHTIHSSARAQDREAEWRWSELCGAAPSCQKHHKNTECLLYNPGTLRSCRSEGLTLLFLHYCDGRSNHLLCNRSSRICRCFQTVSHPTFGWCLCTTLPQTECEHTTPPPNNIALTNPPCIALVES